MNTTLFMLLAALVAGAAVLLVAGLFRFLQRSSGTSDDFWDCWEEMTGIGIDEVGIRYIVTPIVLEQYARKIGKPLEELTVLDRQLALLEASLEMGKRIAEEKRNA